MRHVESLLAKRKPVRPIYTAAGVYLPKEPTMSAQPTAVDVHSTTPHEAPSATSILLQAADNVDERAATRDQPTGERSMARTVAAFNAMYGQRLTEEQGWQFMALLKIARSSAGAYHPDDYTDQAAYSALAGECAAHHSKPFATT